MELEVRNQISDLYNTFFYATMCHVCKRFGDDVHLKRCSACRMIAYCGQQHQKQHWKQHKPLCKAIQDVLQNHSVDYRGETPKEYIYRKLNFMQLVESKLGRRLKRGERHMIFFRRECLVCYEQNVQSLKDCQKCASSFCKSHKDGIEHRDICAAMELCVSLDLVAVRGEYRFADLRPYLKRVFYTDTFQNLRDFINAFGDIQADSEMAYNISVHEHSYFLSRPLTLFHAMRLLNFVPKSKLLVIHVVGARCAEKRTSMGWEVFPRLIKNVMSVLIIMIGPELKGDHCHIPPHICGDCILREKKCLKFEFHNVLYENYVRSSVFVKPDLVVGFNLAHELGSNDKTWAASIQVLAKQNCPLVLTCFMRLQFQKEIDRMNRILGREVDYLYGGENPFGDIYPIKYIGPEYLVYGNKYVIIYKSLS